MPDQDQTYIICLPVADFPEPRTTTSAIVTCTECLQPVWLSASGATIDAAPVCLDCALAAEDPEILPVPEAICASLLAEGWTMADIEAVQRFQHRFLAEERTRRGRG